MKSAGELLQFGEGTGHSILVPRHLSSSVWALLLCRAPLTLAFRFGTVACVVAVFVVQSMECSNECMEIRNTAVTGGKRRIRGDSLDDDASVPYFHIPVSADGGHEHQSFHDSALFRTNAFIRRLPSEL